MESSFTGCISKEDGLAKCSTQCQFCKKRFKGVYTPVYEKTKPKSNKKKRPTSDNGTIAVSVRVDEAIYEKLKYLSYLDNRNISNTIQTMIKNQLDIINYDFTKYFPEQKD